MGMHASQNVFKTSKLPSPLAVGDSTGCARDSYARKWILRPRSTTDRNLGCQTVFFCCYSKKREGIRGVLSLYPGKIVTERWIVSRRRPAWATLRIGMEI